MTCSDDSIMSPIHDYDTIDKVKIIEIVHLLLIKVIFHTVHQFLSEHSQVAATHKTYLIM